MDIRLPKGLGRLAVTAGTGLALCMLLLVGLAVWFLRDTPPVNAAIYHDEGAGMDALLTGTLQMEPECITLDAGDQTWLPIFPSGDIRLNNGALIYQGEEYRSGDELALGGGQVEAAPQGSRIPTDCPSQALWLVSP